MADHSPRRLRRLYAVTLCALVCLTLGGPALIHIALREQTDDGRVIELAGRQRMLGQQLAKAALGVQACPDSKRRHRYADELEATRVMLSLSHRRLLDAGRDTDSAAVTSQAVRNKLLAVDPHIQTLSWSARQIVEMVEATPRTPLDGDALARQIDAITQHEIGFLEGMDDIVQGLVTEHQTRLIYAQRTELFLLAATLAVLVLVALKVFDPTVRTLERQFYQLQKALDEADQANEAKSVFLANVSHEIRTPIAAIVGFGDLLQTPGTPQATQAEALAAICRNAGHLEQLINAVLDFSKIEAGKMTVELVPTPVNDLMLEVQQLLAPKARNKGLTLSIESSGLVPEQIASDPFRIKQALVNLVDNAIKFTPRGGVRMVCSCDVRDQTLTVEVIDQGIGLTGEQIEALFKPYSQADSSTTRRFGGTGLGLAITKQIANLLGGNITVWSQPDVGSIFTLTVATGPLDDVPMIACLKTALADKNEAAPGAARPAMSGRVLVVDDAADIRRLITCFLTAAGLEVTTAEDGQEGSRLALAEAVANRAFGVVIMDMQMPVMDGYSATRYLRQKGYDGQIIAMTAFVTPEDRIKCLDAGCDAYLSKPIKREAFLREVGARMHRPSQRVQEPDFVGPSTV